MKNPTEPISPRASCIPFITAEASSSDCSGRRSSLTTSMSPCGFRLSTSLAKERMCPNTLDADSPDFFDLKNIFRSLYSAQSLIL